jgi:hypothetical protein
MRVRPRRNLCVHLFKTNKVSVMKNCVGASSSRLTFQTDLSRFADCGLGPYPLLTTSLTGCHASRDGYTIFASWLILERSCDERFYLLLRVMFNSSS